MTLSGYVSNIDPFNAANSLLKNSYQAGVGNSFKDILEDKVKEVDNKVKEKASEIVEDNKDSKKKVTKNQNELPDITKIVNNQDKRNQNEVQKVYSLLDKFKETKKFKDEDFSRGARQQTLLNATNAAGQALVNPIFDQGGRKPSKSQLLATWERFAPTVTEDITKKSVRIDIPLLNDVQALVLRLNPDKSLTASLLGSEAMGKLIKENKDKLDKNLKHHHLSLREFNTYNSELAFNSESGTKRQKKKAKKAKKEIDLI